MVYHNYCHLTCNHNVEAISRNRCSLGGGDHHHSSDTIVIKKYHNSGYGYNK